MYLFKLLFIFSMFFTNFVSKSNNILLIYAIKITR
jgi:hypothetical protein